MAKLLPDQNEREKVKEDTRQYLRDEVFHLNFYRTHMLCFVVIIFIFSVIIYGEGLANDSTEIAGGKLRYIDALFLCCSAMTTTGLNTVNLGDMTGFQQAALLVLMVFGNVIVVSTVVVLIRTHYFRKRFQEVLQNCAVDPNMVVDLEREISKASRVKHEEEEEESPFVESHSSAKDSDPTIRTHGNLRARKQSTPAQESSQRLPVRLHALRRHRRGYGAFPAPWEFPAFRQAIKYPFRVSSGARKAEPEHHTYLSFKPELDRRGRIRSLTEAQRDELGGIEYRALKLLLWILFGYQLSFVVFGLAFLCGYAYRPDVAELIRHVQPGNLNPGWWGVFATITSFGNVGLNVVNSNFVPFAGYYLILIVSGFLTLAGNTQFPIFLRLTIWVLSKIVPEKSQLRQTLLFLLQHPRRCYIYLFPSKQTWYLFAVQVTIEMMAWLLFEVLNLGIPYIMAIPVGRRVIDGLFQGTGLRSSGASVVTISSLAPALLVFYVVIMYITSFPTIIAMRQTNSYMENSIGLDEEPHPPSDETRKHRGPGIGVHIRNQLAYDIWFQFLAFFLIAIIERAQILQDSPSFNLFDLLFEVTSAYGAVGLSTGVPDKDYSLSGNFHTLSKLVMLPVMLRGRHRGLPLAIDRSILLPGEDLMHQLDERYLSKQDGLPSSSLKALQGRAADKLDENGNSSDREIRYTVEEAPNAHG